MHLLPPVAAGTLAYLLVNIIRRSRARARARERQSLHFLVSACPSGMATPYPMLDLLLEVNYQNGQRADKLDVDRPYFPEDS